jgi:hypothetical protein
MVEQVPRLLLMLHPQQELGVAEVELNQVMVQKELAELVVAVMELVVDKVMLERLVQIILVVEAVEALADLLIQAVILLWVD